MDKGEYYRILGHWEAASLQLESLETLGPIENFRGQPLRAETEAEKARLRKLIECLEPTLARLKAALDA